MGPPAPKWHYGLGALPRVFTGKVGARLIGFIYSLSVEAPALVRRNNAYFLFFMPSTKQWRQRASYASASPKSTCCSEASLRKE